MRRREGGARRQRQRIVLLHMWRLVSSMIIHLPFVVIVLIFVIMKAARSRTSISGSSSCHSEIFVQLALTLPPANKEESADDECRSYQSDG